MTSPCSFHMWTQINRSHEIPHPMSTRDILMEKPRFDGAFPFSPTQNVTQGSLNLPIGADRQCCTSNRLRCTPVAVFTTTMYDPVGQAALESSNT